MIGDLQAPYTMALIVVVYILYFCLSTALSYSCTVYSESNLDGGQEYSELRVLQAKIGGVLEFGQWEALLHVAALSTRQ